MPFHQSRAGRWLRTATSTSDARKRDRSRRDVRFGRSLRFQKLEDRRLLVAEGSVYEFQGTYDAAGVAGDISAQVRWGDGSSSAVSSVDGGGTSNQVRIRFDYSLDTNRFFSGAGRFRRELLDLAAESLVGRFADDLTAIVPGGDNHWQPSVFHPSQGPANSSQGTLTNVTTNLSIPANEIVIYVGARDLPGNTLGYGGGGSFFFPAVNISCRSQAECNRRIANIQAFRDNVVTRGEPGAAGPVQTDVAPHVGSVSFDSNSNWYFGTSEEGIQPDQLDFLSVAVHELAHVLGFGLNRTDITSVWDNLTRSGSFAGPKARAAYAGSGNVPIDGGHWSDVVEDRFGQVTLMSRQRVRGIRQLFTPLDFAAMDDLGWELIDSKTRVTANHVYADNGEFPVELVLRGSRVGEIIYPLGTTRIDNVAPTLTVAQDMTVIVNQPLNIANVGRITDPGFANLAADPATSEQFAFTIDWGDGSPIDRGTATIDANGNASGPTRATFDGAHTYTTIGTYNVTVAVSDDDGGQDEATFRVTVVPPPALLLSVDRASVQESDGEKAATLTIRRSGPVRSTDQEIELSSSNSAKAVIPVRVKIPAGDDRVSVDITAIDDQMLTGDVTVQLSADGAGVERGTTELTVRDHESLHAEFDVAAVVESSPNAILLTLRRSNTNVADELAVRVEQADASQIDFPRVITIPAGQSQVVTEAFAVDDAAPEPTNSIAFSFIATGYQSGFAVIDVLDDEPPLFQNQIAAMDINDSGFITANDALLVINELGRRGASFDLDPETERPNGVYLDPNGDYRVTAVDALLVINELSRLQGAGAESEWIDDEERWARLRMFDLQASVVPALIEP